VQVGDAQPVGEDRLGGVVVHLDELVAEIVVAAHAR